MSKDIDWSKAPEGATHYCLSSIDGTPWRDLSGEYAMFWQDGVWKNHCGIPSRQMFNGSIELVERPTPAWTGEGLPPVGTVCEFQVDSDDWRICEVVAIKDDYAVCWIHMNKIFATGGNAIRPCRSAEQIAADERSAAVADMVGALGLDPEASKTGDFIRCGILYDAGYRKQEPTQ